MIQTFSRYEKKYIISKEKYLKLLKLIKSYLESDPYSKDDNYYTIYNIYYDTSNNDLVRKSLEKPIYKEKLRLRSYKLCPKEDDLLFLEIKKKCFGKVNKRRISLKALDLNKVFLKKMSYDKKDYINYQVLNEINYLLARYELKPNYYISYHRRAYFSRDNPNLRITFDNEILKRKEDLNFKKEYGDYVLPRDSYLMEIKVDYAYPKWLTDALSMLKIYPQSFSKYGMAYKEYRNGESKCII